tara:strand:+ start:666 stop:1712 length:1047 start_codon:yes stop_codon:yes gene_type:complete
MKEEKISCLCITNNRVDFLKRSIDCFKNQTHKSRELLIFYTKDDIETKKYSKSIQSNRVILTNNTESNGYFIDSAKRSVSFFELFDSEEVTIQFKDEMYLVVCDGSIKKTKNKSKATHFKLRKHEGRVGFQLNDSQYIQIEDNLKSIKISSKINFYSFTKTFSDSIVFANDLDELSSVHPLDQWKKTVIKKSKSNIFFVELDTNLNLSLGYKRNLSVSFSSGNYVCIWDDDDEYDINRLYNQFNFLKFTKKSACSLSSLIIYDELDQRRYLSSERAGGWEGTILCKKDEMGSFASLNRKEDTPVLDYLKRTGKLSVMEDPELYKYCIHRNNISGEDHFAKLLKNSEAL